MYGTIFGIAEYLRNDCHNFPVDGCISQNRDGTTHHALCASPSNLADLLSVTRWTLFKLEARGQDHNTQKWI